MRKGKEEVRFIVISEKVDFLYLLIVDGIFCFIFMICSKWVFLMQGCFYLQFNCNLEGFNVYCGNSCKVRIGILGNNENNCVSCDFFMGFGFLIGKICGD